MNRPRHLLFACALAACGAAAAEPFTLRVMAQESLPPKWIVAGGRAEGVCPDLLAAIEKLEPRLRFSGQTDSRSVPVMEKGLELGSVDALCALLDTPRRRQIAYRVDVPIYSVRQKLAAAADDPVAVNNFDELRKLKAIINTTRGAGYAEMLSAQGLTVDDSTGDLPTILRKVMAGHGRFVYMNELTLGWEIAAQGMDGKIRVLPAVLKEDALYFWVSKKTNPAAVKLVDEAIRKLDASGELARIYKHWAGLK